MHLKFWHILGFFFTVIVGTLLHFTYEWSGENPIVALVSPVNESTWEHLKLLFIPMLFFAIIEYFAYGKQIPNFIPIKVISMIIGMTTIVIVFYTYTLITGENYLIADIATFMLGVFLSYLFSYFFLQTDVFSSQLANRIAWIILLLILFSFFYFTYYPPKYELFLDPNTGTYGALNDSYQ
ncbi:MAG TPA: DUF6512 family protein [Lachnospiraceae bacterium]|nr:DUF6512 family protein [Lachnospiraceae bacterium]